MKFTEECDKYGEACFSKNRKFTKGLNCFKKFEIVFKMKTIQTYQDKRVHLKCGIQLMYSFWLTEELQ